MQINQIESAQLFVHRKFYQPDALSLPGTAPASVIQNPVRQDDSSSGSQPVTKAEPNRLPFGHDPWQVEAERINQQLERLSMAQKKLKHQSRKLLEQMDLPLPVGRNGLNMTPFPPVEAENRKQGV